MRNRSPWGGTPLLLLTALAFAASGCSSKSATPGGGGGPDGGGPGAIVRIEVTPSSLVFTAAGQTHPLTARAFDGAGNEVPASITWSTSKATQVSVDGAGLVRAVTGIGSATVIAESGSIHGRPVTVATVETRPGTLLVTDSQVVSIGPWFAPDGGSDSFIGQLDARLRNVPVPAAGTLVLGTESTSLAGRVVSGQTQGGEVLVRLESVTVPDLLARYDLDWSLPLTDYDIVMDPDDVSNAVAPGPSGRRSSYETTIEKTFPPSGRSPLKCVISGSASITGNLVDVQLNGDAKLVYQNSKEDASLAPGYLKLAVEGPLTLKGTVGLKAEAGLDATVTCELKGRIPVALGPLAIIVAPAVPIGLGVQLKGKLVLASFELGLEGENGFDFGLGVECGPNGAPCHSLDKADPINRLTPKMTVPDQDEAFRVELAVKAYFLSGLDLLVAAGLYDLQILKATVGPVQDAKLAFPDAQAKDRAYASKYTLKLEGKIGLGSSVNKAIEKLMGGEPGSLGAELSLGYDIARSPAGVMSVDKTTVAPHKTVRFTFNFTPSTVSYPVLGDNIKSVVVYRKRSDSPLYEKMQTVTMTSSFQTTWDWTPGNDDLGTNEFFAFVKTKMPVVLLEIAEDSSKTVEVVGICSAQAFAARLRAGEPAAAGGCTINGTLSHTIVADFGTTGNSHVVDMATVTMAEDPDNTVPGLAAFKPSGTWSITRSGRSGDCDISFPSQSGSFSGAPEEGRIVLETGDSTAGVYSGGISTPIVTVTQYLICPDQTIPVTQPVSDPLFLVTPDQGFKVDLDGGVADGHYERTNPGVTESYSWHLFLTVPPPQ